MQYDTRAERTDWILYRRSSCILLLATSVLALAGQDLKAQPQGPLGGQVDNFAFLHYYGTGTYSVGEQTVWVVRIAPAIRFRQMKAGTVGIRLRTALVLALQNVTDILDFDFDRRKLFSMSTGIGLDIPVGRLTTLRPYADIGLGVDNELGRRSLIAGLGMRTEFLKLWKRWRFGLEPGFRFSASRSKIGDGLEGIDGIDGIDGNYSEAWLRTSARYPLWFDVGPARPDIGVYGEISYLFDSLTFVSVDGDLNPIRALYEAGIIFGFQSPRPRVWFITVPSVSVGLRFGGDLRGFRIRFGGDWLTQVPER